MSFSVLVIRIACRSRGSFVLYASGETGARVVGWKRSLYIGKKECTVRESNQLEV